MHVTEAQRTRHLLLRFDRGEELPDALLRAAERADVRAAWIEGAGSFEAAEILVFERGGDPARRRLDAPSEVTRLSGRLARIDGAASLRLWATLASEAEGGTKISSGELSWARVGAIDLHVVALDEAPVAPPQQLERQAPAPAPARPGMPPAAGEMNAAAGPLVPQRPARPREEPEMYPEVGDRVTHFHFGECEVIDSDGDRIRLRQERDGRVREVSLTMLKIDPPTEVDGKRHFELRRKN